MSDLRRSIALARLRRYFGPGAPTRRMKPVYRSGMDALPTAYGGATFRSRLEARWVVFFDALGVEWRYEPRSFTFPTGLMYLPDFYLPGLHCWVEIKPTAPTREEALKASSLARATREPVYLFAGSVGCDAILYMWRADVQRVQSSTGYRWHVEPGRILFAHAAELDPVIERAVERAARYRFP